MEKNFLEMFEEEERKKNVGSLKLCQENVRQLKGLVKKYPNNERYKEELDIQQLLERKLEHGSVEAHDAWAEAMRKQALGRKARIEALWKQVNSVVHKQSREQQKPIDKLPKEAKELIASEIELNLILCELASEYRSGYRDLWAE